MRELFGTGGGWTRLAYLDMSDSTVNCPTGFRLHQSGGVRACGRTVSSGGSCSSVQYPHLMVSVTLKYVVESLVINMDQMMLLIQSMAILTISTHIMLMVLVSLVNLLVNMSGL